MNIDIKAIRAAAEAVRRDVFHVRHNFGPFYSLLGPGDYFQGHVRGKDRAEFIAAANPATVIALLDRLEAAEKDAARMRDELRRSESLIEQYREEAAHRENPDDYVMQY